ncbi:MAG TPA: hypothetical protein VH988_32650 [Thermoanaerobaculia bacterium]|jgi:hypothetical protein|nr:hypothetical protein [Thermoanaerobaculia bacterium]
MTGKEARKQATRKIADLTRLSDELSAILDELPIPAPDAFDAMRRGTIPWSEEAYIAAVIRNADYYVDEASATIHDYSESTTSSLKGLWKWGAVPAPPLERSLRYLVEARSGQAIPPSEAEEVYYDPASRAQAVLKMLLGILLNVC